MVLVYGVWLLLEWTICYVLRACMLSLIEAKAKSEFTVM